MTIDLRGDLEEPDATHWAQLQEGRLAFQRCGHCAHAWLPPAPECPRCLAEDWAWEAASGRATLVSWVVYHRAFRPELRDAVPYAVALVELDEGPRMVASLVDDHAPLECDVALELDLAEDGGMRRAAFRRAR